MQSQELADYFHEMDSRILATRQGVRRLKELPDSDGNPRYYELISEPVLDENDEVLGIATLAVDAGQTIERQKQLEKESIYDGMTNLYNKSCYLKAVEALSSKQSARGFVAVIDLNCLKAVNDIWGHSTGDKAITVTAKVLKKIFNRGCKIFRIGGDEFAIIGKNWNYQQLNQATEEANCLGRHMLPIMSYTGISFGFCLLDGSITVAEALNRADANMYIMKESMKAELSETLLNRLCDMLKAVGIDAEERYKRMEPLALRLKGHLDMDARDIENIKRLIRFQFTERFNIAAHIKQIPKNTLAAIDETMRLISHTRSNVPLNYYLKNINENWDGSGANLHKAGHEIPFYSQVVRLLSICDEKRELAADERKDYIRSLKGTVLAPRLVDSLLGAIIP